MQRIYQLDFLRGLAIIFVILIHAFTKFSDLGSGAEVFISGYLGSVFRPCIAIFIFLSGYLLKDKIKRLPQLLKRFNKVLIPYLFFSFFAIIYRISAQILNHREIKISEYIWDLFLGNTDSIYYFIFIILSIYLLYFLILKIKISYKIFLIIFGIILIIHNLFINDSMFSEYYQYRYLFWPFFFFLGIYLNEKKALLLFPKLKIKKLLIVIWLAIFILLSLVYGYSLENTNGYNSLAVSLYSIITIFLLIGLAFKNKIIEFFSKISYFLFLSHIFAIHLIVDLNQHLFHLQNYWLLSLMSLASAFILPSLLYWIQKRLLHNKIAFLFGL